jgi:release factor glutamine methyltransferase
MMVLTIAEILNKTAEYLGKKDLESPRCNAELMLGHVLDMRRIDLYLNHDRPLRDSEVSAFRTLVERRLAGFPLQYLTGEMEFFSLSFLVSPAVLIPRPETEILVEAILERLPSRGPPWKVVDLGTGSGVVAVSLAVHLPQARLRATDRSSEALAVALRNARRHGVADRISFSQGDLWESLRGEEGTFQAVVSNPPYVSRDQLQDLPPEIRLHEPFLALDGGPDGLEVIRRVVAEAPRFLCQDGILALEMGAGQAPAVKGLLAATKAFGQPRVVEDYAGIERVVMAERI